MSIDLVEENYDELKIVVDELNVKPYILVIATENY
jgi:hypothetical protein